MLVLRNVFKSMTLRSKLYCSVSVPAALALAAFYSATLADDGDAQRLFRMATTFAVAAAILGRTVWLGHQYREMSRRVAVAEELLEEIKVEHDARKAARAWRQAAGGTVAHMRLIRTDDN